MPLPGDYVLLPTQGNFSQKLEINFRFPKQSSKYQRSHTGIICIGTLNINFCSCILSAIAEFYLVRAGLPIILSTPIVVFLFFSSMMEYGCNYFRWVPTKKFVFTYICYKKILLFDFLCKMIGNKKYVVVGYETKKNVIT